VVTAVKRILAALLPALLLAGCGGPVFVPEAGPHAPGYKEVAPPPLPDVEVVKDAGDRPLSDGGAVDNVVRQDGSFEVTGWAILAPKAPRGVLQVVLPAGVDADVTDVETLMRPDAAKAMDDDDLLWAGFTITLSGSLPKGVGVCVLSRSAKGDHRLGNSDAQLCPA
jgi:hypothetical protein